MEIAVGNMFLDYLGDSTTTEAIGGERIMDGSRRNLQRSSTDILKPSRHTKVFLDFR